MQHKLLELQNAGAGGAAACQDVLKLTLGDGVSQVNFDYDHLKPGPESRAASLDNLQQHLRQCPAPKLTKTQAATLAYLWRKGVYHDDARSNIYRLLSSTLPAGCQADTAVESLLASVVNWTPGHPLLLETKECFEPVHAGEP